MANVVIILKVMPKSVEIDLDKLAKECKPKIEEFGGFVHKVEKKPIAFGLSSLNITFLMDESKGGPDKIEAEILKLKGVESVEVIDVRRAFG